MHLNETYYKHPITCQKANKFNNGSRKKPIEILRALNSRQEKNSEVETVIHWFTSDIRLQDNLALSEALKNFEKCKGARFSLFMSLTSTIGGLISMAAGS